MRIHTKVNIWLATLSIVFFVIISLALHGHFHREITSDAEATCRLILAQVDSAQDYVREELRPVMYDLLPEDVFFPESMSTTYHSRNICDRFHEDYPDYFCKFATSNPRNELNMASVAELDIINKFKNDPSLEEWSGILLHNGEPYLSVATPITFSESCMECHGDPADAPSMLVDRYGDTAGFGRTTDDIAIRSVSVPIGAALAAANKKTLHFSMVTAIFLASLFIMSSFLIHRFGTKPLRKLSEGADSLGHGDLSYRLDIQSGDEIEDLANAFNSMAEKIQDSHDSLEIRVVARTLELNRKIAELRDSEEKFQSISTCAQDGIITIDHEGNVSFWNDGAERIFGYTSEEIIGKNLHYTIVPSLYRDSFEKGLMEFYKTGKGLALEGTIELVGKRKDQSEFPLELTVSPFRFKDKWNAVGIVRDITGRKADESRIRRQSMVVDQALEGICMVDLDGIVQFANPAWVKLHRYDSADELIGRHISIFHTDEQVQNEVIPFNEIVSEHGSNVGEVNHARRDGTTFISEMRVTLFRDETGNPSGLLACMTDIADRKESEDALLQAKEDLESVNSRLKKAISRVKGLARQADMASQAKSEFLANMSHEIRTPMNGVIGMTSLLLDTNLTAEQKEFTETIKYSTDSLLAIINDILDISKIEAGMLDLENLDFNLRATVEETVDSLAFQSFEKKIELVCIIEPDVPSRLIGDPVRLRQIMINLVGNSIKFTSEGEVGIDISLENEDDKTACVKFKVSDTGIGIPIDRLDSLWDSFTQVDSSTTRRFGGTGLGLTISKQLAELMGGQIGVESVEGFGSTFFFTVPFTKQTQPVSQYDLVKVDDIRGVRILGVDDNPTNRRLLSILFNNWQCDYEEAPDAETALSMLRIAAENGNPFKVAILDMQMPDIDGAMLGSMIKNDPAIRDTILIMLTSVGMRGDATRLQEIGFEGYLTKPVKQSSLYNCVTAILLGKSTSIEEKTHGIITRHSVADIRKDKVRLLLAEDNPINKKVTLKVLEKIGYRTNAVENGFEVLKALESTDYDLILMDCQMPGMDGYEATRIIRSGISKAIDKNIPIIAITAHALPDDRKRCIESGMNDYLPKPIRPVDLAECLEKWLFARRSTGLIEQNVTGRFDDEVFDREGLLDRIMGDEEVLLEVMEAFIKEMPSRIQDLRHSAESNDPDNLKSLALTIKGSAGNVGAVKLQKTALEIEQAVQTSSLETIASLISELSDQFDTFRKIFRNRDVS